MAASVALFDLFHFSWGRRCFWGRFHSGHTVPFRRLVGYTSVPSSTKSTQGRHGGDRREVEVILVLGLCCAVVLSMLSNCIDSCKALRAAPQKVVAIPALLDFPAPPIGAKGVKTGTYPFMVKKLPQSRNSCISLEKEAAGVACRCDLLRCMAPQFLLLSFQP